MFLKTALHSYTNKAGMQGTFLPANWQSKSNNTKSMNRKGSANLMCLRGFNLPMLGINCSDFQALTKDTEMLSCLMRLLFLLL